MRAIYKPQVIDIPRPITVDRSKKIRVVAWLIIVYAFLLMKKKITRATMTMIAVILIQFHCIGDSPR